MLKRKKNFKFFIYSNFEKGFSNILSSLIPFSYIRKFEGSKIIIPYYHLVSDEDNIPHTKYLFNHRNTTQFQSDLDFFLRHFNPISLFDLIDSVKNKRELKEKSFLLTFDDGYREVYDIIAPILIKRNIPATLFLTINFLDNQSLSLRHKASILVEEINKFGESIIDKIKSIFAKYKVKFTRFDISIFSLAREKIFVINEIADLLNINFDNYLKLNKPFLTIEQVNNLINKGFTVGAHSLDHPAYSDISLKEQINQTLNSLKRLQADFSLNYRVFAFPYSDYSVSKNFYEKTQRYIEIFFGTSGLMHDKLHNSLQRFPMENDKFHAERVYKKLILCKMLRSFCNINQINRP